MHSFQYGFEENQMYQFLQYNFESVQRYMKVSIITASYNAEQTIEQTIKSVLNQSYKDIEYIIIDGASTDLTCQIISKYQPYIRTIISEKDEGLYYAMNKGIGCATGELIGILNSDDIYTENAVSKVVEYYQKTDADVVYGNAMWFEQGKEIGTYRCGDIEDLWYRMAIPHPATFVKAEVYKKYGGFLTKYSIAADYELMLRLYSNHLKFGHLEEVITYFRIGGKSYQNKKRSIEDSKEIALAYISQCNHKDYYRKKIYDKYYEGYLDYFLENDRSLIEKVIYNLLSSHSLKKIVIFGTGKWGQRMGGILQDNIMIERFIDNDKSKQHQYVCRIEIESPDFLKNYSGGVLIAVSQYGDKIMEQVRNMNSNLYILTLSDIGKVAMQENEKRQIRNK